MNLQSVNGHIFFKIFVQAIIDPSQVIAKFANLAFHWYDVAQKYLAILHVQAIVCKYITHKMRSISILISYCKMIVTVLPKQTVNFDSTIYHYSNH